MVFLSSVPRHELRKRAGHAPDTPDTRHRDVLSVFGDLGEAEVRSHAGVLFRLEEVPGQAPSYLIRSEVRPENLPPGSRSREESGNLPLSGTPVAFRLAVNAVQRVGTGGIRPVYPDGAVQELLEAGGITEEEAEKTEELGPWIAEKLFPGLVDIHVLNHRREVVGRRRDGRVIARNSKTVQIDTVDGVALVGDVDDLRRMLINGVGRAKSYGCGLLTIKPV